MKNKAISLVVLAAGMGSRYGGLKQMDALGPNGETILDYSVYDAVQAGFDKVVFVVRDFFADEFHQKIGSKFDSQIEVKYVCQPVNPTLDYVPIALDREKPWGTNHAVLVAKEEVSEPFAVINADDYYGRDGFLKMADFLRSQVSETEYAMIGYPIRNTLSESGTVNRGVCVVEDGYLKDVVETLKIREAEEGLISCPTEGQRIPVDSEAVVSMNFWGFHENYMDILSAGFRAFVMENYTNPKAEYYIPNLVDELIKAEQAQVRVMMSEENWYGVTYKEDAEEVRKAFVSFADDGKYPPDLWAGKK